jgi:hypothetical protein
VSNAELLLFRPARALPQAHAGINQLEKILIPGPKTSLTFASPLFIEGPCSYRSIMGRVGGAELKVPETQISASPEGSTRGASLCEMLHRWTPALSGAGRQEWTSRVS